MNPYLSHQAASGGQQHPRIHTSSSSSNTSSTSNVDQKNTKITKTHSSKPKGTNGNASHQQLHPKNFYRIHPVDFYSYAAQYPTVFGPHIEGIQVDHNRRKCTINWKSITATRAVCQIMLKHDFQVEVDFLPQALIPPLPNRLNYLCWLSDLHESNVSIVGQDSRNLTILDIGTGSNVIYPLLGVQYFQYKFIGSEVNPLSVSFAQQLIQRNQSQLKNDIHIVNVPPTTAMQQFLLQHYLPNIQVVAKPRDNSAALQASNASMSSNDTNVIDIEEADMTTSLVTSQSSAMEDNDEEEDDDAADDVSSQQSSTTQPTHQQVGKLLDMIHAHLLTCANTRNHHQQQASGVILSNKKNNVENEDVIASRGPIRTAFANANESCNYRLLDCEHSWLNGSATLTANTSTNQGQDNNAFSPKRVKRASAFQEESSDETPSFPTIAPQPQKWRPILFACMTNPPFYDLSEEIQENEETVCNGTEFEMKTIGGEVAFIASMIVDSFILRESIIWYTAMVGKKSSLKTLKKMLLREGLPPNQMFTTVFAQGVTHRWGFAWTFVHEAAALYACFGVLGSSSATTSSTPNTNPINPTTVQLSTSTAADPAKYEFDFSFEQYLATSLVEETKEMFVYLQSRNVSINTESNVALTALVPIIATRMNLVCSKLEEAYTSINIKSHVADISFITSQGTFGHTASKGSLRVEIVHNALAVNDPEALSVLFHIHYVDSHFQKQLATLEIFVKIFRLLPHGYIQLRGKVNILGSYCSSGLVNRLQHRTFELLESEFLRNTRK